MDAETLRRFKRGERIISGCLLPGLDIDEEIVWTCTRVSKQANARVTVEFELTWLGVFLGRIKAEEGEQRIAWSSVQ